MKKCYNKTDMRKRSFYIYAAVIALSLIVSVLSEFMFFTVTQEIKYDGKVSSVYAQGNYETKAVGYKQESKHKYLMQNNDPSITFHGINKTVEGILIKFASALPEDTGIQVFYAVGENYFSAENSTNPILVKEGTRQYALTVPKNEYSRLRFDINGDFILSDIEISNEPISIVKMRTEPINPIRMLTVFAALAGLGCLFVLWIRGKKTAQSLTYPEFAFCVACFVFYTLWAINKPFNYAPDENARYLVSEFLYQNSRLPAYDEAIISNWGFSYAHLPTVLCHLLDWVAMKLGSLFTDSGFGLLLSARMVSVGCATGAVYCTLKTSKLLFNSPAKWIMTAFVALLPQFAFLASYVNNDIISLFGATVIFYAWVLGIKTNWNLKNCTLLVIGISICGLSYYNSYAWILCSILLFVFTFLYQNPKNYKKLFKYTGLICLAVFLLIGYFFIRHLVLYDDILGLDTMKQYGEMYGVDHLKPSNRLTPQRLDAGLFSMLFGNYKWVNSSYRSFIGCFGYMQYELPEATYTLYTLLILAGVVGTVMLCLRKKPSRYQVWLCGCLVACIVITVALSMYNSYTSDFQPQGRYCIAALPSVAFFVAKGLDFLLSKLPKKEYRYLAVGILCGVLAISVVDIFNLVYLPS